ncbi:TPA: hypothetical protein ACHJIS_003469, partial [Escherichia coli]
YGYDSHNISIYWIERTCKAFKITKVMVFYLFIYKNNKITAHSYITYCFYYHTSETIAVLMLLSCFTRKKHDTNYQRRGWGPGMGTANFL